MFLTFAVHHCILKKTEQKELICINQGQRTVSSCCRSLGIFIGCLCLRFLSKFVMPDLKSSTYFRACICPKTDFISR